MADPIAASMRSSMHQLSTERKPRVAMSLALVIGYWWAATGVTFALQLSEYGRAASLIGTPVLAALGGVLIVRSRNDATAQSARQAFFGAALVWWWGAVLFYGGVGLRIPAVAAGASGSVSLAAQAIAATARADLVMVLALVLIAAAVRKKPNKVALWTLAAFWGTLQTAKLNVFFGVLNSGAELLPARLAGLIIFFGPSRNSALLIPTLLILAALLAWLIRRMRRASDVFSRHAFAMMTLLIALALLEHIALGVSTRLPLWDVFLMDKA